jgi:phosphatidylglycerophosphate synthase
VIRLVVVGEPAADGANGSHAGADAEVLAAQARSVRVPVGAVVPVSDVEAARAAVAAAAGAGEAVALVPADLVAHSSLLGDALDDPRRPVAALVLDDARLGALRLDPDAARAAVARLDGAEKGGRHAPDVLDRVLTALTAAGRPVAQVRPGRLVARRPGAEPHARADAYDALASTSEHATRLAMAARPADGFYSTFVVRRLSRPLTGVAVRFGVSPNTVTLASLLIGLAAAFLLTSPAVLPRVLGAVLLQVSLVVDCVDGEVARYTRRFTPLGAWLDGVGDRVKEYAVLAALALATQRADAAAGSGADQSGWFLAIGAMVVMTYRHVADHGFTARARAGAPAPPPGLAPVVLAPPETPLVWLRRVLQFPVGERWLLLSVAAALGGPRAALVAFGVGGLVSAAWTTSGRVLRSLRMAGTALQQFGWLLPAAVWVAEAVIVDLAFVIDGSGVVWPAFALLAVVAYHLYDTMYRAKYGVPQPVEAISRLSLGPAGQGFVVALAALVSWAEVAAVLLAGWLVVVYGIESGSTWWRWLASRPRIEEER